MTIAASFTRRLPAIALIASGIALGKAQAGEHHGHHMHDEGLVHEREEIGMVDFRVSCDAVRADFDRALGLMHHMMYAQARQGFESIIEADPECGMGYWGVATTLFQPLWGTRPSEAELARGARLSRDASEFTPAAGRERLLVEATAEFFRGDPDDVGFWTRIERWNAGMRTAFEAHPDDADIAALYALTNLAIAQRDLERRDALHDEAEQILRAVWERKPTHPGAIHYSIHATDVDGRAENALDMVEVYADIAPQVPHALHMPSHIYVRLGEWDEVIEWNRASADAAVGDTVDGGVSHHYVHAIDYMMYAYLQKGEDRNALKVYAEAMEKDRHQPTFISAYHLAAMPARKAVERRKWDAAAALEPRTPDYLPWDQSRWPEGIVWFARGMGSVHVGELDAAREAERRLARLHELAMNDGDEHLATYIEVDRRILAGWLARADGDAEKAARLIRSAAELERTVEKHPVTPGALLPPNEALGDLLVELGRPAEAVQAYLESDAIWPGRFNTLAGAMRAAEAAGKDELALELSVRLLEIAGESDRLGVAEAREIIAMAGVAGP